MPLEYTLIHFEKKFRLLAITYSNKVQIVKILQHSTKIMTTIEKPSFLQGEYQPIISWGEGYFKQTHKNSLLLMIIWNKIIYLLKVTLFDDELEFHKAAYMALND